MKRSNLVLLLVTFVLIPLTLYFGTKLSGRWYYLTGTLIVAELLLPFFLAFERRRPQARELVVIAVLCAIAATARVIVPIPHFKPMFAVIMLSGIAFGPEAGFLVGAVGALASSFFYTQGPYLPWQMLAYGVAGLLSGFFFYKKLLPQKPWVMGLFGFFGVLLVVGPILDTASLFLTLPELSFSAVWSIYLSGIGVNCSQGLCTLLILLLFGRAFLEKLERVKMKYGMMEGSNGL